MKKARRCKTGEPVGLQRKAAGELSLRSCDKHETPAGYAVGVR
jgi:hypothetical protein